MNADLSTTLKCSASGRKSSECLNTANVSTRVVASVLLPHTSCISLCTILVNYTTCTQTLSPTPFPRNRFQRSNFMHVPQRRQSRAVHLLPQTQTPSAGRWSPHSWQGGWASVDNHLPYCSIREQDICKD